MVLHHLGVDRTRAHGVGPDRPITEFDCGRAGQLQQAALGSGVGGMFRAYPHPLDRRDVHDRTASGLDHPGQDQLGEPPGGRQVDREGLLPFGFADLPDRLLAQDSGVVDESVEAAHLDAGAFDQVDARLAGGDVGLDRTGRASSVVDECRSRIGTVGVNVGHCHRCARRRRHERDRSSDATCCTGHQDASPRQVGHRLFLHSVERPHAPECGEVRAKRSTIRLFG